MQVFSTPAFLEIARQHQINLLAILPLLGARGQEPSWIVGSPEVKTPTREDGGCTLKIPAPQGVHYYVIRDDHEVGEYAGQSTITALMSHEY
jgi:hypothetical protein